MGSITDKPQYVAPSMIRHQFSNAMSCIYKAEVPLYSNLLSLVSDVNNSILERDLSLKQHLEETDQFSRLQYERHGAIRLGTASEMATMARFLSVMDMHPVGYYDLSLASLPVHATCFRTLDLDSLNKNPFRLFVSLLRPSLIPEALHSLVGGILSKRAIFSRRTLELIQIAEDQGGLSPAQVSEYISNGLETFKWTRTSTATTTEYQMLKSSSPLLADIVAFPTAHINHLTPRTLDIEAVQAGMKSYGLPMKESIEGPPGDRNCLILLRQTSFKAMEDEVLFLGDGGAGVEGRHCARFGEVEQRGAALTPKGRKLYDDLVGEARARGIGPEMTEAYAKIFARFPDSWDALRKENLAWLRYYIPESRPHGAPGPGADLDTLIAGGWVKYEPITYEDFLPLSAAGIFQSNLGREREGLKSYEPGDDSGDHGRGELVNAIGLDIHDEMVVYRDLQEKSIKECLYNFRP
ncbi:hypothetical protein BP6252_03868 [Coleophoma cylindrospora]|uniref:2-oxoadipate dioxygenase/decarboxylase n=1 Tax=Coleophoma cylindrospora TaxID=1849047 RepID=A0A3D8S8S6_9HELO|nr:hypothetical protein BP6252_03868 [Coleophoma cylindrospora]